MEDEIESEEQIKIKILQISTFYLLFIAEKHR